MKKFIALILLAATWYFAGMHRSAPMMATIICGVIFVVAMSVLTTILKRSTSLSILPQQKPVFKGREGVVRVRAENRFILPVNRFTVSIEMKYRGAGRASKKKLNGCAPGSRSKTDRNSEFCFFAPYCGIVEVKLKKLRVYDYLQLFSSAKRLRDVGAEIAVLPYPKEMKIDFPNYGAYTFEPVTESSSDASGDDLSEIRLVREYRPGDLTRHIHRNYSARTQKLWVKEYRKENDYIFDLLVDLSSGSSLSDIERDAVFEIVCSVAASLMKRDVVIRAYWYDAGSGNLRMNELRSKKDVSTFMLELINSDTNVRTDAFDGAAGDIGKTGMIINSRLEWYFLGKPVFRFDADNVERQLSEQYFDLRG